MATDDDYRLLLRFRTRLREFEQWSSAQAEARGLTTTQHQLLLAVRGSEEAEPTIGDVAELLLVKHHTAGELVDRTQALGLVERVRDREDHRRVRLRLTPEGRAVLEELTELHAAEVRRLGGAFPFSDEPAPAPR